MDTSNQAIMRCLQHAAHLSNLGAYYLSIADDDHAYMAYKKALDVLRHATNNGMDADEEETTREGQVSSRSKFRPVVAIPFDSDCHDEIDEKKIEDEDKSCYFVCTKPLCFDVETLDSSCTTIYIVIAIFGMALLLLRKARKEPHNRSLYKALKLYNMALTLLHGAPTHVDTSNLLIATLNNKIYICYCIHQFEEAHTALVKLTNLLPEVCNNEDSMFEDDEINGMILNSLLPFDLTRLAPAA
jgi:tetratricopeptide (TPR) repeat protein